MRPEELLDMLSSEEPQGNVPEQQQPNTMVESKNNKKKKKKKKKETKPDAYLNQRIKWTEGGETAYGTVMSIAQLKGKGGKLYLVKWDAKSGWGENRLTLKQVRDYLVVVK